MSLYLVFCVCAYLEIVELVEKMPLQKLSVYFGASSLALKLFSFVVGVCDRIFGAGIESSSVGFPSVSNSLSFPPHASGVCHVSWAVNGPFLLGFGPNFNTMGLLSLALIVN